MTNLAVAYRRWRSSLAGPLTNFAVKLWRRHSLMLLMGWIIFYLRNVRRIKLHKGRRSWPSTKDKVAKLTAYGNRLDAILGRCPSLGMIYWPTFFAPTALLQCVLLGWKEFRARFIQPSPYEREVVQLRDKACIALDWVTPRTPCAAVSACQSMGPVCVLLHGAFQGSESATMIDLAVALAKRGHPVVVMNRRGYGEVDLGAGGTESAVLHMFGDDEDLDEVLRTVANHYPGRPAAIIGFSCGATFSGRYVANRTSLSAWSAADAFSRADKVPRILCAVAYDPGYDIASDGGVANLSPPYSWVVNWCMKYFYAFRHRSALGRRSASCNKLVTEVLNPFMGLHGTYRRVRKLGGATADSSAFLKAYQTDMTKIEVPSLFINSRDDPISVWANVEHHRREIDANPNLALAEVFRGAHGCKFGFTGGSSITFNMIAEFVEASSAELRAKSGRHASWLPCFPAQS